jgi:hypothetical protein
LMILVRILRKTMLFMTRESMTNKEMHGSSLESVSPPHHLWAVNLFSKRGLPCFYRKHIEGLIQVTNAGATSLQLPVY